MATQNPLAKETDADLWYRQKVLNAEFDQVPESTQTVEVEVPEEVEAFVRKRYHDLRARGKDVNFTDLLLDHITVEPQFVLADTEQR
ncbi:hypothetical protein C5B86_19465 [Haloferax sp. Atlit-19N]|uniref:hypothetical protein n=1 Tax=Haloferax sp. Atlit-19N TaxID=2077201 RepID=UPI000E276301|nr:hypothetical protein [Haloferax sp. Atlit-19N]RDZ39343.1 hypothetical protein C5B86_19465 [Haloferax sp. Atlit-19N]